MNRQDSPERDPNSRTFSRGIVGYAEMLVGLVLIFEGVTHNLSPATAGAIAVGAVLSIDGGKRYKKALQD